MTYFDPKWGRELIDPCEDILQKAQMGSSIPTRQLAEKLGFDLQLLRSLRTGIDVEAHRAVIVRLSQELALDESSLIESCCGSWLPRPVEIGGLEQFITPFRDFHVNHFLVTCPRSGESILFDTGTESSVLSGMLARRGLRLRRCYLTHGHLDHIAQLDFLRRRVQDLEVIAHPDCPVPVDRSIEAGQFDEFGGLKIEVRPGTAHRNDLLTFAIEGLEKPVLIAGDSIFAGSIGSIRTGNRQDYLDSLENVRRYILCGEPDTVICPGHGPMTTVGEELLHNPFFASSKTLAN
ncbi:MAG: MBL fold metallo-hydrolase [Puniceicoccaceae bacterium]